MSTTKNLRLKFNLNNGSTSVLTLPAPINDALTIEGEHVLNGTFDSIAGAFATDSGATINSIDVFIVQTTVDSIETAWTGDDVEAAPDGGSEAE